jgi:CRISPR/Cas system-associated exonuclease Cas4 (RecB family)
VSSLPDIEELAKKYAPWSWSKLTSAESCPAQFHHKHVLKTQASAAPSDTQVGVVAHAVLERRLKGVSKEASVREAIAETPLTTQEEETLSSLDERMEQFLVKFDGFCKRERAKSILVEQDWGLTADLRPTSFFGSDVFFRGKVDVAVITGCDDVVIVDHKSGFAKDLYRDQKKKQQLNTYAVLALANIPDMLGVRGAIHFLQGDPDKAIQWTEYVDVKKVREVYAPWLFDKINEVASELKEPFEAKPKLRWPCNWCSYKTQCKAFNELYPSGGKDDDETW